MYSKPSCTSSPDGRSRLYTPKCVSGMKANFVVLAMVTRTAEVFVITPKNWKVAYHGPVNDAADYGIQKASAKSRVSGASPDKAPHKSDLTLW